MRITTATPGQGFRPGAVTTEQLVFAGPCVLYGLFPELTTTGTLTVRDGAAADGSGTTRHVCAIGLTQAGKGFGPKGVFFTKGLTIQMSVGTDITLVQFEPVIS
jgi:hypothetical protein